jgi:nitroreductase
MNPVLEALRSRRSGKLLKPDPVPRELVETVLSTAVWAPNHHKTEPWRFVVLTGAAREALGEAMEQALRERLGSLAEGSEALLAKERAKPLRAPVLIVAAAVPSGAPKVVEIEEVEATAAAVENMLLAAQSLGLGAMWRTGEAAYDPRVKRFLGLPHDAHIVSFLYLGYPDLPDLPQRERSIEGKVEWRG